jgi:hypothetical protein
MSVPSEGRSVDDENPPSNLVGISSLLQAQRFFLDPAAAASTDQNMAHHEEDVLHCSVVDRNAH